MEQFHRQPGKIHKSLFYALGIAITMYSSMVSAEKLNMTPGLWEHSYTVKTQSGELEEAMAQMQQRLAGLPPEQRKMVEQMMAAQGVGFGEKVNTIKMCITQGEIDQGVLPQQEGCTQTIMKQTPNRLSVKFSCTDPPASGEGEVQFQGPKQYSGNHKMITQTEDGKSEIIEMTQTGRWLSADCGNIRPIEE